MPFVHASYCRHCALVMSLGPAHLDGWTEPVWTIHRGHAAKSPQYIANGLPRTTRSLGWAGGVLALVASLLVSWTTYRHLVYMHEVPDVDSKGRSTYRRFDRYVYLTQHLMGQRAGWWALVSAPRLRPQPVAMRPARGCPFEPCPATAPATQ